MPAQPVPGSLGERASRDNEHQPSALSRSFCLLQVRRARAGGHLGNISTGLGLCRLDSRLRGNDVAASSPSKAHDQTK